MVVNFWAIAVVNYWLDEHNMEMVSNHELLSRGYGDGRQALSRRGRPTFEVTLSDDERETLEHWARRPKRAQALALRCRIVLAAASGEANGEIAAGLGCHPTTVGKWRRRFAERPGRPARRARPGKPRSIRLRPAGGVRGSVLCSLGRHEEEERLRQDSLH